MGRTGTVASGDGGSRPGSRAATAAGTKSAPAEAGLSAPVTRDASRMAVCAAATEGGTGVSGMARGMRFAWTIAEAMELAAGEGRVRGRIGCRDRYGRGNRAFRSDAQTVGGQLRGQIAVRHAFEFLRQCLRLLALCQRYVIVHLGDGGAGRFEIRPVRQRHQRIGAHPVARRQIAVEMTDAQEILRARIAAFGGSDDIRHRLLAAPVLKQQQAVYVDRPHVALGGGLRHQDLGLRHIGFDPAPQTIGLRHVELRIGVAPVRQVAPFGYRHIVIAAFPCGRSAFQIGLSRHRESQRQCGRGQYQVSYLRHGGETPYFVLLSSCLKCPHGRAAQNYGRQFHSEQAVRISLPWCAYFVIKRSRSSALPPLSESKPLT